MLKDHVQEVGCPDLEERSLTDVSSMPAQKLKGPLTLDEARALLATCTRNELNDHAFGDSEVCWFLDGKEVASGYFGTTSCAIGICQGCQGIEHTHHSSFEGADARALRYSGVSGKTQRNDSTG